MKKVMFLRTKGIMYFTQGELNLYRFFASGDEANYSASYGYPAVDNHVLVFSIDTNMSTWERVIDLDIRSANIYTRAKTSGTWGPWVTLLSSENYTGTLFQGKKRKTSCYRCRLRKRCLGFLAFNLL